MIAHARLLLARIALWRATIALDAAQGRLEDAYTELAAARTDEIVRDRAWAFAARDVKLARLRVGRAMQRRAFGI